MENQPLSLPEIKHTVAQSPNGEFILNKNGVQAYCPKIGPLPVPKQLTGEIQLMRCPCSTLCPFASIIEKESFTDTDNGGRQSEGKKLYYQVRCEGGHPVDLQLSTISVIEKKEPAKLMQL